MAARRSKSKRGSGANSTSPQPPEITFFLDRCLGRNIVASALRAEGCRVEVHSDHFADDAPDEEWLPTVGGNGWIVLTMDYKIHRNQVELSALLRSGAATFVLRAKKTTGSQMAKAFIAGVPTMRRFLKKFDKPFVATLTAKGSVSMLYPLSVLTKKVN